MAIEAMRSALSPELRPWIFIVLILVLGAATLEGVVLSLRGAGRYDWRAYAATLGDVAGRLTFNTLGLSIATPVLLWAQAHRVASLPLDDLGSFALLFIGQEFCYYVYHRTSHRVRWFWATHCVHHTPNELTLAAALRLGWTGKLTGTALFFAPLVWLGFPLQAVLATLVLNLLYQFWLHAPWIPRLGPLEWVLNTPSHHRVHHASNAEYLDCNYGGVLIVFDRLFGSFVEERLDIPPRYGLTSPMLSHNPLWIGLHEWVFMARDLAAARSLEAGLRAVFGRPGSAAPDGPAAKR